MHVWKFLLEKLMCGEFILNLLLHPRAYISRRMILKEYDIDLIYIFQAYISFIDLIFIFQVSVVFAILGLLAGVAIYMDPEVGFLHF